MTSATTVTALKWIVALLLIAAVGLAIALTVVVVTDNNSIDSQSPTTRGLCLLKFINRRCETDFCEPFL